MRATKEAPHIDPIRLDEASDDMDRGVREMIAGLERHVGYPFDQIGHNLRAARTLVRCAMLAAAAGAPKERVAMPAMIYLEIVDSLFPHDEARHWRAASVQEQQADGAGFDQWQATVGPDASDFELRRGIELALAQKNATERFIRAAQIELGRRRGLRHMARRQLRRGAVAR